MPVRLTDIPGLRPTLVNMPEMNPEKAAEPGVALGELAKGISSLSDSFRELAPRIQETENTKQVLDTRKGFRDDHAALQQQLAKEPDKTKRLKLIEQYEMASRRRLDSPGVRPEVRARMEDERAEHVDNVRITETANMLSQTSREAYEAVGGNIDTAFEDNDGDGLRRTLATARGGNLISEQEEQDVLARFETKQVRDQAVRDLHADPGGWLERNPRAGGKKEPVETRNDRKLAYSLIRQETARTTAEVSDAILSGRITDKEQIGLMSGRLRPAARERLMGAFDQLLDTERHESPVYQNQTIGEISEMLSGYRPDADDADERYVRMDLLLRTLPEGPARAELQGGLDRARDGTSFVPETPEQAAMALLDRDFNTRLEKLPKVGGTGGGGMIQPFLRAGEEGKLTPVPLAPPGNALERLTPAVAGGGGDVDPEQEDAVITQRLSLRETLGAAKAELLAWTRQNKGASSEMVEGKLTEIRKRQMIDEAVQRNLSRADEPLPGRDGVPVANLVEALAERDPDFDAAGFAEHRQRVDELAAIHSRNFTEAEKDALASFDQGTGQLERLLGDGTRGRQEIARAMMSYRNVGGERDPEREERRRLEQGVFLNGYPQPAGGGLVPVQNLTGGAGPAAAPANAATAAAAGAGRDDYEKALFQIATDNAGKLDTPEERQLVEERMKRLAGGGSGPGAEAARRKDLNMIAVQMDRVAVKTGKDVLPAAKTRKEVMKDGLPGSFFVAENPAVRGDIPTIELPGVGNHKLKKYEASVRKHAAATGVDPLLIQAILYMEESHGYYDEPLDWAGKNKSIRPMNINVDFWGGTFGTRKDMEDPDKNVQAGAAMLGMIHSRLPKGHNDVATIATLYNNINAPKVSEYGARVARIYEEFKKQQRK